MGFNVGLNVVEVDGRAAPSIQPAPTSVTGFVIRAERGIPGKVIPITNWSQYQEHFGSYMPGAHGAYAVRGFFDNGGSIAMVTRVVNTTPGSATAPALISDNGPWSLTPGGTLTFHTNLDASPINVTFEASSANMEGDGGPFNLEDSGVGKTIELTVNDVNQGLYQFVAGDFSDLTAATVAEVTAVLNREFTGIQAWVEAGNLRIRTDRRGMSALLQAGGSAAADLGLEGQVESGAGNVPDIDAVLPEQAVPIFAAALGPCGLMVSQEGQTVVIRHPDTGPTATIQINAASSAVAAIFGFDTAVHAGTDDDPMVAAIAASADFGTALKVAAGYRGDPDVGNWANGLDVRVTQNIEDPVNFFDLSVVRKDPSGKSTDLEAWSKLSMNETSPDFIGKKINDEHAGSKFIMVSTSGTVLPSEGTETLAGGRDGAFADRGAEVGAYAAAIDLFDLIDIQLLACPEAHEAELVNKGLTHCENMGDRMFVGHTPETYDATTAKDYAKGFRGDKKYGALYFPWISVADPLGGRKWIPPTGHILGAYARTERERGIWKAPAGNAARLNGALDVRFAINDIVHTDMVKNGSLNAIRDISGQGIIIDSSRTLSTSPLWLFVNIRLLFNFVKSSLKNGLRWVVQEPNDRTLWGKVKYNSVTPFLMGLWRRGAFGPGPPEKVFDVKIDEENNPPDKIQQGILTLEVYFYPSRPAETIILIIGQQEGGASATEA
jgi:uncharacterized protein